MDKRDSKCTYAAYKYKNLGLKSCIWLASGVNGRKSRYYKL